MRSVQLATAFFVVLPSIPAFANDQGIRLLTQFSDRMHQTTGAWEIANGELAPKSVTRAEDYCGDVGAAFFPVQTRDDFTLRCEFQIPKGSTGAGGPSVFFGCTDKDNYHVVHLINYWNTTYLMRRQPGTYETLLGHHIGAPLQMDAWHRLQIQREGAAIRITLDGRALIEAASELRPGFVGLGARIREVRYRAVRLVGGTTEAGRGSRAFPRQDKYLVVCRDSGNGAYEAFPGLVRLSNGDLMAIFYSGWTHVSKPGDARRPKGGRISCARSTDGGQSWTELRVIGDTPFDDRDPFLWQASDGTLHGAWPAVDWVKYQAKQYDQWCHAFRVRSEDLGRTWSKPEEWRVGDALHWTVWTAPRLLPNGSWLMPIYKNCGYTSAAFIRSRDGGATWSKPALLDPRNRHTDEPDIVVLPQNRLLCIMRPTGKPHAWQAWSEDWGETWTAPRPLPWYAHAPNLLLTRSGVLLCAHRDPGTAIHYSLDYGKTWAGMVMIDSCGGAYPAMVELPDGRIVIVYYSEGRCSDIRGQFLRASKKGVFPAEVCGSR